MSLTMDDLIGVCANCAGTGKRPQESNSSGGGFRRTITYPLGGNPEECVRCAGTGRWGLTETGRVIGEFAGIYQKLKGRGLDG
jgi:hypothetical protein